MRPTTEQLKEGERWYVDGKPGEVYTAPYPTGYFSFHYDGKGFATSMNVGDLEDNWERCEESAYDISHAKGVAQAAKLGIKL
jgi:hypothetical protein